MNPFDLSATALLVWGLWAHWIGDWPLQNDWMATNKMKRRHRNVTCWPPEAADWHDNSGQGYIIETRWWDRHPAAYVHAGIHGVLLTPVFGWPAVILAVVHLLVDTRHPVIWWSKLIGQSQPGGHMVLKAESRRVRARPLNKEDLAKSSGRTIILPEPTEVATFSSPTRQSVPLYDIGTEVRLNTDQVFHYVTIGIAALLVTL